MEQLLGNGTLSNLTTQALTLWEHGYMGVSIKRTVLALAIMLVALMVRRPVATLFLSLAKRAMRNDKHPGRDAAIVKVLHAPAQILAPLIGLIVVSEAVLQNDRMKDICQDLSRSLVMFALFWGLFRVVDPILRRVDERSPYLNTSMLGVAMAVAHIVVFSLGAAALLDIWGIRVGPILAGFGLVGAAVALGAQDLFKNLIGGIFIIIEDRFQIGDWISADGICEGTVEAIGLRTTTVRQFDMSPIYVPNSQLSDTPVVNNQRMTHRRISWSVGLTYDCSAAQIKQVCDGIRDYLTGSKDFVQPPEAPLFVRLDELGDSAINIMVYCFTRTTDWGEWLRIKEALANQITAIAAAADAGLAFPSQSLYIETFPRQSLQFEAAPAPAAPAPQKPA